MSPERIAETPYPYPACAAHAARLEHLEEGQRQSHGDLAAIDGKLDGLKNWLMGLLVASVGSLIGVVIELVLRHK